MSEPYLGPDFFAKLSADEAVGQEFKDFYMVWFLFTSPQSSSLEYIEQIYHILDTYKTHTDLILNIHNHVSKVPKICGNR